MRKATLLTLTTIAVLVGGIILGIPVLTRTAIFMGSLNSKNGIGDKDDNIPPGAPQIFLSYDATNSAIQTISGLSEPGSTVFLTQNTQPKGEVVADNNGRFEFIDVNLTNGDNLFSAVAMDQANNKSLNSSQIHLYFSSEPPKLEVSSPTDRQVVSDKNYVSLVGSSQNTVRLSVNDRTIILNSNGQFNTNYSLSPGDNILVFTATDGSGNQTRKEMTITYNPQ
jgi:hypothetical protein